MSTEICNQRFPSKFTGKINIFSMTPMLIPNLMCGRVVNVHWLPILELIRNDPVNGRIFQAPASAARMLKSLIQGVARLKCSIRVWQMHNRFPLTRKHWKCLHMSKFVHRSSFEHMCKPPVILTHDRVGISITKPIHHRLSNATSTMLRDKIDLVIQHIPISEFSVTGEYGKIVEPCLPSLGKILHLIATP